MTHYLRTRHDAIMIGVGTAVADEPVLNSRLEEAIGNLALQPRPVVVDPRCRWSFNRSTSMIAAALAGRGRAPWVLYAHGSPPQEQVHVLQACGGKYIHVPCGPTTQEMPWEQVLSTLTDQHIHSVMIEGGGTVINSLLALQARGAGVVDSIIVTIAPVFLGDGGVVVRPTRPVDETHAGLRLQQVRHLMLGDDIVICGLVGVK